jgi:hypothetical protein
MDFGEALKILSLFSGCRLRIFRQFSGFPKDNCQQSEAEYVIFADASVANELCYRELSDYAESLDLCIVPFGEFLMVSHP